MLPLDALAKRFLVTCAVLFVVATALKLNGSSIFLWKEKMHDRRSEGGLLLSTPKNVRSDEWAVWTPAVLWQAEHDFPITNPSLGAGKVPLIYNLPVRYYTGFFRPQFYGFFLFDLEHAYSWYWNCKVFGLLAATFLLLRVLTKDSAISLFGALWLYLSSYTQWWFSCPPLLPEMLASWAVCVISAIAALTSRNVRSQVIAAFVLFFAGINFVLCLYPPFQIPLLYLGAAVIVGFVWSRPVEQGISGRATAIGASLLLLAVLAGLATLWPFFVEIRPTLEILAQTAYPGVRRVYGGALTLRQVFAGAQNFFDSETAFPEEWGSVNGSANFYPLWIPMLAFTWRDLSARPRKHALEWMLLGCVLAFGWYAVAGLPQWFCHVSLLSFCTEERMLLPMGAANILFCALSFRRLQVKLPPRDFMIALTLSLLIFAACFYASVPGSPRFLTPLRLALLAGINFAIVLALAKAPRRWFYFLFLSLLGATNLLVNPLMAGLGPLVTATPRAALQKIRAADPDGVWVVYDSNTLSDFIMSTGATVLSGVKLVPDLAFYRQLDPEGHSLSIYNRYGFACFSLPPARGVVRISYLGFPSYLIEIEPNHSVFSEQRVRYFVFPEMLAGAETAGLRLREKFPENYVWIYERSER